jgi:cytochrome c oxidase subunit 1
MATTTLSPRATTYTMRSRVLEWLTTTDHKKIGIMYITTAYIFFLLAGLMALGIRTELAFPGTQILEPDLYNQAFTMHGTTMIFFFVMPMLAGFANYIVPLQVGAADMAFPRINALSFWIIPFSGVLLFSGFIFGGAASGGWTSYTPLSEATYSTTNGQDHWLAALILNGVSSIMGAINFLATTFRLRAPGMTMLRLPIFTWTVLVTNVLLLFAVPVLAAGMLMLFIDRNYGGSFFNPAAGGDTVLWQHVFWFFGHPEVYILILPAFGVISEVIPVFSRKPLFGYKAFVIATVSIGVLGFGVWAHHMFTTGAVFLPFFSITTFLIAVPTGVKMFNWIATMWRGKIVFKVPMLFAVGFLASFLIGGLDGAFSASTPIDFALQDTYWIVSHLHYVLFGGSALAIMAATYYWFPKMTGRFLSERIGKIQFWIVLVATQVTFFPMHLLGLNGMPRRIQDYAPNAGWQDLNLLATIGSFGLGLGVALMMWNIFTSLRGPRTAGDDPWEGNTLEWATTSPPPSYNFDRLPEIRSERPLFDLRHPEVGHPPALTAGDGATR